MKKQNSKKENVMDETPRVQTASRLISLLLSTFIFQFLAFFEFFTDISSERLGGISNVHPCFNKNRAHRAVNLKIREFASELKYCAITKP